MTPPEHVAVVDVTVDGRVEAARSTSWLRGPARAVALSVVGSWSTERSAPGAPAARLTRDGVGGRLAEPVSVPGGKRTATASLYRTGSRLRCRRELLTTADSTKHGSVELWRLEFVQRQ